LVQVLTLLGQTCCVTFGARQIIGSARLMLIIWPMLAWYGAEGCSKRVQNLCSILVVVIRCVVTLLLSLTRQVPATHVLLCGSGMCFYPEGSVHECLLRFHSQVLRAIWLQATAYAAACSSPKRSAHTDFLHSLVSCCALLVCLQHMFPVV
jgi:hypothetical protein